MDIIGNIISTIQELISDMGAEVIKLLPTSPFLTFMNLLESSDLTWLRWLNWICPIGTFIAILQAWLAAIASYYVLSVILRWVKAIS